MLTDTYCYVFVCAFAVHYVVCFKMTRAFINCTFGATSIYFNKVGYVGFKVGKMAL